MSFPPALQGVIDEIGRFPGVGPKSAQRIAFWLMRQPNEDVQRLSQSLMEMTQKLELCQRCCNIAEVGGLCEICADAKRDQSIICVVESPPDVAAFESFSNRQMTYHVLHGVMSPLQGITADRLKIQELMNRLDGSVNEVILGLSSNVESDHTLLYLQELLRGRVPTISKLRRGLPMGGDIEYVDGVTLAQALAERQVLEN